MNDVVMIAVDPHKASNTAAVLDPVSKTLIESARFANTMDGYAQLTAFAGRWAQRRWAVEGCFGAGRSLAQRLVADGEMVLDVPAKWPPTRGRATHPGVIWPRRRRPAMPQRRSCLAEELIRTVSEEPQVHRPFNCFRARCLW